MSLILSGTDGLSDVDGSAATPAIRGTDANTGIFFPAADTIAFAEGGVEAARFDSSGNFGLGVTPNAWGGSYKALQFSSGCVASYSNSQMTIGQNFYDDGAGSYKYVNTASATRYLQSGLHYWYVAASGTAGSAITWTQAMTLDTSGKLFLGTTSTGSAGLNVSADCNGTASANSCIHVFSSSTAINGNNGGRISFSDAGSSIYSEIVQLRDGLDTLKINNRQSASITFGTNNTERARIDSSGNLLVGTTSNLGRLSVVGGGNTAGTYAVAVYNSDASKNQFLARNDGFVYLPSTAGNTTGSAANLYIDSGNGAVYRSTSSLKYKQNIQNAVHGLADLLQLRSVTYEGKAETDAGKTFGGLIAEEVHEAGLTEFVQYAEDGSPDALAYGNMVSLCIKAIQEQQAIITQLTARITALENK